MSFPVRACARVRLSMHVQACVRASVCAQAYMCVCAHAFLCVHARVRSCVFVCACVRACMCVCERAACKCGRCFVRAHLLPFLPMVSLSTSHMMRQPGRMIAGRTAVFIPPYENACVVTIVPSAKPHYKTIERHAKCSRAHVATHACNSADGSHTHKHTHTHSYTHTHMRVRTPTSRLRAHTRTRPRTHARTRTGRLDSTSHQHDDGHAKDFPVAVLDVPARAHLRRCS